MSKCIICKKENDGILCKHCISKNAGTVGGVIKKGGKLVSKIAPALLVMVLSKGKIKPKI